MLVLTRKIGEGIAIGDDVKIIVMQIKGKQVRLGIKASPNTIVHREEVYQRILEENKAAASSPGGNLEAMKGIIRTEQDGNTDQEKKAQFKWLRRRAKDDDSDE